MNKMLSCGFNIDTGNVELRYADGSMISIDCTEVEAEVAMSINARSELNWLIYNAPWIMQSLFYTAVWRIILNRSLDRIVGLTGNHKLLTKHRIRDYSRMRCRPFPCRYCYILQKFILSYLI